MDVLPRVGLDLTEKIDVPGALAAIRRAEERGVPMVWSTVNHRSPDAMTFFAAAAVETERVGLGTAIVPTYPRHPTTLATQVMVLNALAPSRFRLGIGPSHRSNIVDALGLDFGTPLDHLREYVTVLRALLSQGEVDFSGDYFSVHAAVSQRAEVPIYISALRPQAFRLAGEVADGAISWLCPVHYLRTKAIPAMQRAAERAGRPAPRMVAHVPVVMSADRQAMLDAARPRVSGYGRQPFYANMFADAGYPVGQDATVSDDLLDHLIVWGTDAEVRERLEATLDGGIDELLVMLIPTSDPAVEEARLSAVLAGIAG